MSHAMNWVLTDVEARVWVDSFSLLAGDVGLGSGWSIRKQTLRGGLSDGVDLIEIDNGQLSISLLPTRGMGIWRASYHGLPIGWKSPARGPVHPQYVNLQERGGLGWLAGFDEAIVRCGLDNTGAPGTDIVPNNMGVPSENTVAASKVRLRCSRCACMAGSLLGPSMPKLRLRLWPWPSRFCSPLASLWRCS